MKPSYAELADQVRELQAAQDAKRELVRILELEPMGGRPDDRATWDDIIAAVAQVAELRTLRGNAIQRRAEELRTALHAPGSATWPELVAMVVNNVDQCTGNDGTGERCVLGAGHPGECEW
jgi:hypothetical protein